MMRVAWIGAWLALLLAPAACGESFTSSGGGLITGPSGTLRQACERYCDEKRGCEVNESDAVLCVDSCRFQLAETGACSARAIQMLDCYRERSVSCELPSVCMPEVASYAQCQGFGCAATDLSCGTSTPPAPPFDCWCSGSCGGTWTVSAQCNLDVSGLGYDCSCGLTGNLAPYQPIETVNADCSGEPMCSDEWGCCRDILLPSQ